MQITNFRKHLEKIHQSKKGFDYKFGKSLQLVDFKTTEQRLHIEIPEKIKDFYLVANGLKTSNPDFEVIELESWIIDNRLIHFATFDHTHKIYFNITKLNLAQEWTILNKESNYVITLTISSFWSNKIWHWLEQNKKIWTYQWQEN